MKPYWRTFLADLETEDTNPPFHSPDLRYDVKVVSSACQKGIRLLERREGSFLQHRPCVWDIEVLWLLQALGRCHVRHTTGCGALCGQFILTEMQLLRCSSQ